MTDERLEQIIANLLRAGVALSAAVVAAGGVWYLASSGATVADYGQFHPEVRGPGSLGTLPGPLALIQTGLLLLIATPVVRVIFALVGFALERDRIYVGITLGVLMVLAYSILIAWL